MKQRIYFDNAATSWPKPEGCLGHVCRYIEEIGVNTGRGVYASAVEVSRVVFDTRKTLSVCLTAKAVARGLYGQCHPGPEYGAERVFKARGIMF